MDWSNEQVAIFEGFRSTTSNMMVNASPGSGKTTIALEVWRQAAQLKTLYLAFNKAIVTEMLTKVGTTPATLQQSGKAIQTFNSFGSQICYKYFKPRLNASKIYMYIHDLEYKFPEKKKEEYTQELAQCVRMVKSNVLPWDHDKPQAIEDIIEYFDLDEYSGMIDHTLRVLKESNAETKTIDFSDQLLFPLLYDLPVPYYDLCIVDETQDVNAIQRELLRKLIESNPQIRFLFVGDSRQAIYAFRGALADSMQVLGEEFCCTPYPLTVTRRCASQVVDEAKTIWPDDINAAPDALEGIVRPCENQESIDKRLKPFERDYAEVIAVESFTSRALLLCRTTAPLVNFAYQLLKAAIPCHIRGREIGEGFIKYIKKSECQYTVDFLSYLAVDTERQIERARQRRNSGKIQALLDRKDTLEIFAEQCSGLYTEELIQHILTLFEHGKGILLSTVHKAKGLEAEQVFLLAPDLMPHPLATKCWEKEQERNIHYVAITRAKIELIYL